MNKLRLDLYPTLFYYYLAPSLPTSTETAHTPPSFHLISKATLTYNRPWVLPRAPTWGRSSSTFQVRLRKLRGYSCLPLCPPLVMSCNSQPPTTSGGPHHDNCAWTSLHLVTHRSCNGANTWFCQSHRHYRQCCSHISLSLSVRANSVANIFSRPPLPRLIHTSSY